MKAFEYRVSRGLVVACLTTLVAGHAMAAPTVLVCKLQYKLKGWSAIYSRADGTGTVTCGDGTSKAVVIKMRSIGAAVGKSEIDHGVGKFTDVYNIDDVLGTYAQTEVDAGLLKSGAAQVLTKGTVSLALAGAGEGIDLGVTVGEMTLEAAK